MACVGHDPGGRRRILFVDTDGRRKTIRLGKIDRQTALRICRHVEVLLTAKRYGQPLPGDTAAWLAQSGEALRAKLAAAGLVAATPHLTVAALVDQYLARQDVRLSTRSVRGCWGRRLVQLLGDRPVSQITPLDAEAVRDALVGAGLAPATVGRCLRFARQLFRWAVLSGASARNPFDGLAHNYREGNLPPRDYARVEDTERLLAVCPPPWRVLLGLARYAALRCPSEALLLRWQDVDLTARRLTVTSPKTATQGKPWRQVPIFPRLAELLAEAWEQAPEGAEYVVALPGYRGKQDNWQRCNLRTQLQRLMRRAGVFWQRPFRLLRSSCVTDWANQYPIHYVAAWAGHTVPVAGRHYLTVMPDNWEQVLRSGTESGTQPGTAGDGREK
jgi:integrase